MPYDVVASQTRMDRETMTAETPAELWQLVRDYAKQETVDPLRSVGRFLAYGLAGALLFAIGSVFAVLAVLRVLQEETGEHLTGSWNFLPYLVALVLVLIVIAVSIRAITRPNRADRTEGR